MTFKYSVVIHSGKEMEMDSVHIELTWIASKQPPPHGNANYLSSGKIDESVCVGIRISDMDCLYLYRKSRVPDPYNTNHIATAVW